MCDKSNVKKQLIRHTIEKSIKYENPMIYKHNKCDFKNSTDMPSCSSPSFFQQSQQQQDEVNEGKKSVKFSINDDKLAKPQLQTTLEISKHINAINSMAINNKTTITNSKIKDNILKDLTYKLNFPNDKSVYKDLIPINVNDSVLELNVGVQNYKQQQRLKLMKPTEKDPEPILTDFLKHSESFNLNITSDHIPDNLSFFSNKRSTIDNYENIVDTLNMDD